MADFTNVHTQNKRQPLSGEDKNIKNENKPIRSQKSEMVIGNTTYKITTSFSETATETADETFLRIVTNRISNVLNSREPAQIQENIT